MGQFIIGILLIVVPLCIGNWLCNVTSSGGSSGNHSYRSRGRAISGEELERMTKDCIGKSTKEAQRIQHWYLYEKDPYDTRTYLEAHNYR